MKQVEFDIELVKKIQSGEVKGIIKTRNGRKARFIGEVKNKDYPFIFAIEYEESNEESPQTYTASGEYMINNDYKNALDIILEIEEEQQERECQFKPFDKVLVRDNENGSRVWQAAFYSHFAIGVNNSYYATTAGNFYLDGEIIPYEGNEHLVGTTDKPKEDRV